MTHGRIVRLLCPESQPPKALVTIVRHKGVIRASEVLHLAQSSVTARIRALEEGLGVPMFERKGRHLALTAYGEALLPYAERVTAIAEEAESVVSGMRKAEWNRLVIGLASSAPYLFADVYRQLEQALPHLHLHVVTGHTGRLYQMLQDGVVHLAVIRAVKPTPQIVVSPLYRDETVIVGGPHRTWSPGLQPSELVGERLVVFDPGSSHALAVGEWLSSHGLAWDEPFYTDDVELAKGAVAQGTGLCFLSRLTVAKELADGRLTELPVRTGLSRSTVLAYRKGRVPAEVLGQIRAAFGQAARDQHDL